MPRSAARPRPEAIDLNELPGHYIRRLHQIAVAIFLEEVEAFGITPVQFAALQALANAPLMDQRSLARTIGLDTSTVAGVIDRLQARDLVLRQSDPDDRRIRRLSATPQGLALLAQVQPAMQQAQGRILAPLKPAQQRQFMRMLRELVNANNALSRAPSDAG